DPLLSRAQLWSPPAATLPAYPGTESANAGAVALNRPTAMRRAVMNGLNVKCVRMGDLLGQWFGVAIKRRRSMDRQSLRANDSTSLGMTTPPEDRPFKLLVSAHQWPTCCLP